MFPLKQSFVRMIMGSGQPRTSSKGSYAVPKSGLFLFFHASWLSEYPVPLLWDTILIPHRTESVHFVAGGAYELGN